MYRTVGRLVLALFLSSFAIAGECQTSMRAARDQHIAGWKEQLATYARQIQDQQERVKRRGDEHGKVVLAAQSDPWGVLISQVFELAGLVRETETTQGRHDALLAFVQQMEQAPAPGVLEAWFIRRSEDVRTAIESANSGAQSYLTTFDQKIRDGPQAWVPSALLIASNQGRAEGWAQELQSLYRQAIAYYSDIGRAQAEERQRAEERSRTGAALMALGAGILLLNGYQQQMLNAMNRPRTCSVVGNMVTCY